MNMIATLLFGFAIYFAYKFGQSTTRRILADSTLKSILAKTKFPVAVAEKIEGHYYLYEKDTTNFLCQAEKLEDIPLNLWENKKISMAALLCPEDAGAQIFWCINGKLVKNNIKI